MNPDVLIMAIWLVVVTALAYLTDRPIDDGGWDTETSS